MSDIPDDVRVKLASEYIQQNFVSGEPWSTTIARAILDERERCTKLTNAMGICEQYNYGLGRSTQNYYRATSAIRRGDNADDHLDEVVRKWNGMPPKNQEVAA